MAWLEFECCHRYESGFELNVAFAADEGVTALVGPSGSGKSTILACVSGVLRPDVGRITLGGATLFEGGGCDGVGGVKSRVWIPPERREIGVVFQERLLFPHMSVRQNLLYAARRTKGRAVALDHLLEVLELGDLLDRYPHTLSGGQRQRVALGRAVLRAPKLLLLDEPTIGLDAELKDRVLDYVRRTIEEYRIPTLLVSHSAEDVSQLAATALRIGDLRR